jgi:hypothetical protein
LKFHNDTAFFAASSSVVKSVQAGSVMHQGSEFVLSHDLSPISAKAAQSALLAAIGGGGKTAFRLEIESAAATQVAIQLLFSGERELRERGIPFELGPIASELMERSNSEKGRSGR